MEKRMTRSLATRFGILATDIGKLRRSKPDDEPHMTRIIKGEIDIGSPTQELDIRDLMDVRDGTASKGSARAPAAAAPVPLGEEDIMLDALAGAQMAPAEDGPKEITQELDIGDLMEVRGEARPKAAAQPPIEEEPEGDSPSVVASLLDLRRIADQRVAEEKEKAAEAEEAAKDKRVADAMAAEIGRYALPPAAAATEAQPEAGVGSGFEDPEDFIESGEFELPQITVPMAPNEESRIPLFNGPEEGKTVRVTPLCSVHYLDYDRESEHALLRVNHEASGAYESINLDLRCKTCPVFATDEGLLVGLKSFEGRIDAKIVEAPPQLALPNFKSRFTPGEELDSFYWNRKSSEIAPVDLGHGYYLGAGGGGFGRDGKGITMELYLSERGNPKEYSMQFPYLRRFRLERGEEESKTFMIGQVRVDIKFNKAGVFITKREILRKRAVLPKPSLFKPEDNGNGKDAFEKAFARSRLGDGQQGPTEEKLHGFEDVMERTPESAPFAEAPAEQRAESMSIMIYDELGKRIAQAAGSEEDMELLRAGMGAGDKRIRKMAAGAFATMAERGEDISADVPVLTYLLLNDSAEEVRKSANDALFYARQNGVPMDTNLANSLTDPRRDEQSSVVLSLADLFRHSTRK